MTPWITVAAIVASLAVGIPMAWFTARQVPRRRLVYGMGRTSSLLADGGRVPGLRIMRNGQELAEPVLVELAIGCKGTRSITRQMFDGRPLRFDLGVPVVAIVDTVRYPVEYVLPEIEAIDETSVGIMPGALHRKQIIELTVLTDGRPVLSCKSPLADVDITNGDFLGISRVGARQRRLNRLLLSGLGVILAAAVGATALTLAAKERAEGALSESECARLAAEGKENIPADHPDYKANLDRDNDGIACES